MKKTQKKIFGFLGLVLVAAVTFLAACLPNAETSAISTSMTDTLTVRVVSNAVDVNLTSPENEMVTTSAEHTFSFDYANANTVTLILAKKKQDGTTQNFTLITQTVNFAVGSNSYNINLQDPNYGYGDYIIKILGEGAGGLSDEDSIAFSYYPVTATDSTDEDTGAVNLDLDYDPYNPSDPSSTGEVAEIEINVYDEDGYLVEELSPITVTPPDTRVEIPFGEHDLPGGSYTVKTTAYDKDGNKLYEAYINIVVNNTVPVPNTGGLFKSLNISKADYLITGVIIFLLTGIFGAVFIAKRHKKSERRR